MFSWPVALSFVRKTKISVGYMKKLEKRLHPRRTICVCVCVWTTTERKSPFHSNTPALVFSSEAGSMMKPEMDLDVSQSIPPGYTRDSRRVFFYSSSSPRILEVRAMIEIELMLKSLPRRIRKMSNFRDWLQHSSVLCHFGTNARWSISLYRY